MSIITRPVAAQDNEPLLNLMASAPMSGWLQFRLQRAPNIFDSFSIAGQKYQFNVAVDSQSNQVIGCMGCWQRQVIINGRPTSTTYVSDIRIHPKHRGKGVLKALMASHSELMQSSDFLHAIILKGNTHGEKLLAKKVPQYIPRNLPISDVYTWLLFARKKSRKARVISNHAIKIRPAVAEDITAMQSLHDRLVPKVNFASHYDFQAMVSADPYYRDQRIEDFILAFEDGKLVGFLGLWDQSKFKQTVLHDYHWSLKLLRPGIDAVMRLMGFNPLPRKGAPLKYWYVNALTVDFTRVDVFQRLLDEALIKAYKHKLHGISLSLGEFDTRQQVVKQFVASKISGQLSFGYLPGGKDRPETLADVFGQHPIIGIEVCRL